jgi:hypothetical protein
MPKLGKKEYPYTEEGYKAYKKAKKKRMTKRHGGKMGSEMPNAKPC